MNADISFTINGTTKKASEFGLITNSFEIPTAQPKTSYVQIDGADSALDLTETFGLTFNDLVFNLNFQCKRSNLANIHSFVSFANGNKALISPYNDENRYYDSRLSVGNIIAQNGIYSLTVGAIAKPYRFKKNKTVLNVTNASEGATYTLTTESMPVVPTFTCSAETTIAFKDKTYTITSTTPVIIADIVARAGDEITITSTGTVKVEYQEGSL